MCAMYGVCGVRVRSGVVNLVSYTVTCILYQYCLYPIHAPYINMV